jgi:mono/diheme cytochrome c family protein
VTNGMSSAEADRIWGRELEATDHQAVFKKDCARCHLAPAFGKYGQSLYVTACGICHEAKHPATMVPDLHALKTEITPDYWKNWVTHGKAGTLMPGFSAKEGGPLDNSQIASLVDYLTKNFPRPMKQPESAAAGKK